MDDLPFDLAAQQLVELLELVSSFSDETAAQHSAVERAAQVLEAEVAAVVVDGRVVYSVGFPAGAPPHEQLVEVALGRGTTLDVPRLGRCAAAAADLDGPAHGHLVLARLDGHFSPAEWNLLRGMARILDLSLRMLRTMDSLRQRQRLMEHLYRIQRSISRRMPLPEVLDTVVHGIRELLGDEMVGLWLPDQHEPGTLLLVASAGPDTERLWRLPAGVAAGGRRARSCVEVAPRDSHRRAGAAPPARSPELRGWAGAPPVPAAKRIRACLRADDVAARFGGDEFAVMLHGVNAVEAGIVAGRIIEAVERPYPIGGDVVTVGASIGVAMCESARHDADELLRRADAAVYPAKRNGRRRVERYEAGMELRARRADVGGDPRQGIIG